jgi:hypothetical protein
MQSSNLTKAVLGTLADAYPTAVDVNTLAAEVRCEPEALHKHLRLLHDVGAVRANGLGALLERAAITDAGLALVDRELIPSRHRPHHATHHSPPH